MKSLKHLVERSRNTALAYGPYAAALLLPGGSVVAGLMWLYRNRKQRGSK